MGNRFHTTTTTSLIVGSLLLLSPVCALAAGLGKLSVLSALGQPLRAEIDIVAMQPEESESLVARIAAPETFKQAGVDYGAVVPQLRATIEHRADGRAVLALKSVQPVNEPFVDVLVELDSATGHLVRQYTFLLDPVGYAGPEQAVNAPGVAQTPAESPTAARGGTIADVAPAVSPVPVAPSASASEKSVPQPAAAGPVHATTPASATAVEAAGVGVEVKKGDTLAAIAEAHRPQDVSLQRMLVALYQANAEAFIKNNMNLVRAGAILRIPDAAELEGVVQADAVRVVNTQARAFNAYRASLAAAAAAGPAAAEGDQQRASGRITTMVEEKPAPGAAGGDELRLSRATEGEGSGSAASAGDDAAAGAKALQEADERVAELERNVKDLQKLLELKNSQLAALQQHAQGIAPTDETVPAAATAQGEAAAPTETLPDAATDARPDGVAQGAGETAAPAPEAAAAPAAETAKAAKPAAKPAAKKKAAPPPPPEEPSFIDSLLDDPVMAAGGGGAIIALLLGLLVWRRRRAAAANASLVGMTTTDSSSVFGTTGGRSVDTGASALQTDFDQSGIGSIDTEEVDPVAEADVYMAYGRDAQAEEILKEALQKDPGRQAVRIKLLEIYASRKDAQAFAAAAAEVRAATHGEGDDWAKIAALGQTVDPGNALYGAAETDAPAAPAPAAAVDPDAAGSAEPAPPAAPVALDFDVSPASVAPAPADDAPAPIAVSQAFDLDLGPAGQDGDDSLQPTPASGVSQALDLDLDLNLGSDAADTPTEVPADFSPGGTLIMDAATKQAVSELGEPDHGLDFELDVPTIEQKTPAAAAAPAGSGFGADAPSVPAVDLSGLSLDVGDEAGGDADWQEVATKLDLAKAYEEMGDKDGARELLNEVIKEGDGTQQAQARTMLEALR